MTLKIIDAEQVQASLNFPDLIDALDAGFARDFTMPTRQVFSLASAGSGHDEFAVLPAWNDAVIGVKVFTYFPENSKKGLESLYSKIMLFRRDNGVPLSLVDGTTVTYWRTAAISALASRYLSREDSRTLLLLGTGNLARYLVAAHLSVRPLDKVILWGRNLEKAQALKSLLKSSYPDVEFTVTSNLSASSSEADIIVSATGSPDPLIFGRDVSTGTHVDLLGNHQPDRRECDTELVTRSQVYADS